MGRILFFVVALGVFAYVSATTSTSSSAGTQIQPEPFSVTFSKWLVDAFSQKVVAIARHFNFKIRLIRFLVSLYTNDNLNLLRTAIEYALSFGNLILRFLPTTVEDPGYWWIPAISQLLNITTDSGGLFGLFLGSPTYTSTYETESSSEDTDENLDVRNPPIFFNAPVNSTKRSNPNEVDIRETRSTNTEKNYVNEVEPQIVKILPVESAEQPDFNEVSIEEKQSRGAATNPPILINTPENSTEQPNSHDVNIKEKSTIPERQHSNEGKPQIVEPLPAKNTDAILDMYQDRIMSLDKLINSRKR